MQELYRRYKGLLFKLAYQLTGSAADAEDAVQDVFLSLQRVENERLAEPKAYLCKMVTNRCLDVLRSARKQRERYFGEWLPEPILTPLTPPQKGPLEAVIDSELLSYAMLVLLERLTPAERAVFVLREALCLDYGEIAALLDKSEANCRKLLSRARKKMELPPGTSVHADPASQEWVRRLLTALEQGRAEAVVSLLAKDAVLISDGGGKALAAVRPIASADRVAGFLLGLMQKARSEAEEEEATVFNLRSVNGQTGIEILVGGKVAAIALLQADGRAIRNLYLVRNPDKLANAHLFIELN